MSNIIKGTFGPKPECGNPNPGDPRQPSPPVVQGPTRPGHPKMPWEDGSEIVSERVSRERAPKGPPAQYAQPTDLPPEILKALSILQESQAGKTAWVLVGIRPTATGADFLRECYGQPEDLRSAFDHLHTQIERLYVQKKLLT